MRAIKQSELEEKARQKAALENLGIVFHSIHEEAAQSELGKMSEEELDELINEAVRETRKEMAAEQAEKERLKAEK